MSEARASPFSLVSSEFWNVASQNFFYFIPFRASPSLLFVSLWKSAVTIVSDAYVYVCVNVCGHPVCYQESRMARETAVGRTISGDEWLIRLVVFSKNCE